MYIEDYMDSINENLVLTRVYLVAKGKPWFAVIPNAMVKTGSVVNQAKGIGMTPEEAIHALFTLIRGKEMVINYPTNPKTLIVPDVNWQFNKHVAMTSYR